MAGSITRGASALILVVLALWMVSAILSTQTQTFAIPQANVQVNVQPKNQQRATPTRCAVPTISPEALEWGLKFHIDPSLTVNGIPLWEVMRDFAPVNPLKWDDFTRWNKMREQYGSRASQHPPMCGSNMDGHGNEYGVE